MANQTGSILDPSLREKGTSAPPQREELWKQMSLSLNRSSPLESVPHLSEEPWRIKKLPSAQWFSDQDQYLSKIDWSEPNYHQQPEGMKKTQGELPEALTPKDVHHPPKSFTLHLQLHIHLCKLILCSKQPS